LTNISREARRNIVVTLVGSVAGLIDVNFKDKYPRTSVTTIFRCKSVVRQAEWKDYINLTCNKKCWRYDAEVKL